jgi:excisionase family DNA binding protein
MNTGDSHRAQARQANVPSRLLSVREAANYLGISTWTLRALVRAGAVPRVSLPGVRRLLFDREELDRVIERHLS